MQGRWCCLTFIIAVVLGSAGCAARSTATVRDASAVDDWSAVMTLTEGTALRLDLSTGSSTSGRLVSVKTTQITISTEGSNRTLLVPDIRRVAVVERRTRQKARRGFIIGAVAGGLFGRLGTQSNQGAWAVILAAGWGAIGAAIGASDGFFDHKEMLVYVASNVDAVLLPTSAHQRPEPRGASGAGGLR
jgi:hypothetical protein